MKPHPRLLVYLLLALFSALCPSVNALTWSFTTDPTQCGELTVEWSGGTAPFTLLLVPTGHVDPETRTIIQEDVSSGNSVAFQLNYPANSTFVAVLNDATGIGAGGTSVVTTVEDSSNTSCLNTQAVSPEFYFFLPSSIDQCDTVDITWDSDAETPVDILGLIPGGQSFEIANITDSSTSFDWTADVRSGTEVVFVAGNKNGLGKGGSSDVMLIGSGSNDDCINSSSPSSTTGNPAGGVSSTAQASETTTESTKTQSGQLTTTDNAGGTITINEPPIFTTTNSAGHTVTVTAGQASFTTTDSVGHTITLPGNPLTTTDNSGSTATIGGSSFPGSGGGTVTGSNKPSSDDSSKNHLPLILGLVFGLLALFGLLIGAYILYRRRKAHKYQNLEKSIDGNAQPWFASGAHLRGGANSSISTLPEMYQTEPFILPSEPHSYYNYSPVPTPGPTYYDPHQQERVSAFIRPQLASRMNNIRSTLPVSDNAPFATPTIGYDTLGHQPTPSRVHTSLDSKHSSAASVGPHGRPVSRTSSGTVLPARQEPGMLPVSSPDPPTRVARDSEDLSPEAEEASPNPFEDPVVDIPPTYASVRRASTRRSLEQSSRSFAPWGPRDFCERAERPGRTLHRSNASRRSIRSEMQGDYPAG